MPEVDKLTLKQKRFADKYLETGNGTKAIKESYNVVKDETAWVMASENLRKPKIIQYLQEKSPDAANRIIELMKQDDNLHVALGAAKDVLDRAGFKPVEQSINTNIDIIEYEW